MFCPTCGSEYLEQITECGDCRVALVRELPKFEDSEEPLRMIRITGPTEAPMIKELLQNNGIDSILQGEAAASTIPAAGDLNEVRIWVQNSAAARANEIVEAFFDDDSEALGENAGPVE
jgi:hypothetical protein